MKRRKFLTNAGVGAASAAAATSIVAAPAIAQSMPEVKWRLTSSFPKSLDTLYGGSELFAKMIGEMSDNKFQVRVFAAGEIVPGLQVADAVQNGTVEAGQTAAYYFFGKHPNFVFETGLPFSMNQRQYYAWCFFGGGTELINEFYKEYNFRSFPFGGTGAQMGGWFRKELKTMDDMKGLKFRVGGFAGLIFQRLGVVPQQIAGGDIYPALEKGTIDAGDPAALRRLVASGTELRPFPRTILEPCFNEAYKYYDELSAKDPKFKKIYDSLKAFRADQNLWFRVAENTFDNFNFSMSAQGR